MLPGVSAAFSRFERQPRWIDSGGPSSTESSSIGAPPPNNSLKLTRRAAPQLLLVSPAIKP